MKRPVTTQVARIFVAFLVAVVLQTEARGGGTEDTIGAPFSNGKSILRVKSEGAILRIEKRHDQSGQFEPFEEIAKPTTLPLFYVSAGIGSSYDLVFGNDEEQEIWHVQDIKEHPRLSRIWTGYSSGRIFEDTRGDHFVVRRDSVLQVSNGRVCAHVVDGDVYDAAVIRDNLAVVVRRNRIATFKITHPCSETRPTLSNRYLIGQLGEIRPLGQHDWVVVSRGMKRATLFVLDETLRPRKSFGLQSNVWLLQSTYGGGVLAYTRDLGIAFHLKTRDAGQTVEWTPFISGYPGGQLADGTFWAADYESSISFGTPSVRFQTMPVRSLRLCGVTALDAHALLQHFFRAFRLPLFVVMFIIFLIERTLALRKASKTQS